MSTFPTRLTSEPYLAPLPVSPPPLPASPTYPLGYRAAMIRLRAETPSTSHPQPSSIPPSGTPPLLPIPLPTPSPPLLLSSTVCRGGVSEVTLPPWKRFGLVGTLDDEIRQDLEREIGFGITDTWDGMVEDMQGIPTTIDVAELSQRITNFVTIVRKDTYEIYGRLDDAHDDRLLMSGQLNMLRRDRRAHACTTRLMETEAKLSRCMVKTTVNSAKGKWREKRKMYSVLGKVVTEKESTSFDKKTKISVFVPDDRYAVSSGSGYAVLISLNEYAVMDRKLDTPYPMEVDTPYSTIN
ncbi:hypothetical protein Tco_0925211 [Tanacetum coccineum]|uniref:Uncharacterized protein n=1 Tax=Tanacetum coccineum TaxID=301880 RepID=A0ABQ5D7K2_9ASTR